jgi:hypothetical protein
MKHWHKIVSVFLSVAALILVSFKFHTETHTNNLNPQLHQNGFNGLTFMDIYENILQSNCALSNCHDGNFEPDFTSPQAAYYTTVWQAVKKNSLDYAYTYRIQPYDTAASLLYERITNCCFNNEEDRMPLLMGSLTSAQIDSIALWIMSGAPDIYGEFPYQEYGKD